MKFDVAGKLDPQDFADFARDDGGMEVFENANVEIVTAHFGAAELEPILAGRPFKPELEFLILLASRWCERGKKRHPEHLKHGPAAEKVGEPERVFPGHVPA